MQRKITTILGGWQRLTFNDLYRPALSNIVEVNRNKSLKIFIQYINYVNESVNNRIDVDGLDFMLNLAD